MCKSITHLTLTFYSHYRVADSDEELPLWFDEILNPKALPLLEHLEVRVLDVGKKLNGLPTRESIHAFSMWPESEPITDEPVTENVWDLDQLNAEDAQEWRGFVEEIRSVVESRRDPRMSFKLIGDPDVMRQKTLLEDVRKHTLHEWRERVAGRAGPWSHPQTQTVKPQVVSFDPRQGIYELDFWKSDLWDEVMEDDEYAWDEDEDADEDDDDEDDEGEDEWEDEQEDA